MKRLPGKITLSFLLFFLGFLSVHAQQFKWVRGGGTTEDLSGSGSDAWEQTKFMCTDPNGNVYALSQVGNNPIYADTFRRLAGAYGADRNILLTSYNCNGQMRWAKLLASSGGDCTPYGIEADSFGHVYVAGDFVGGGALFHIGYDATISPPTSNYLSTGLIQFDTLGTYKWIRYVGDNTFTGQLGMASLADPIAIDGTSDVHYFCYMQSGEHLMTGVTSSYGVYDLKYDVTGTLLSAVRLAIDTQWYLRETVIDPSSGKLYVVGEVNSSYHPGITDTFFAAAFDVSRSLVWQYFCGHGGDDFFAGIVLDQSKHLYFSGGAQPVSGSKSTFSFNNNSDSVSTPTGFFDMSVIMKTDTSGNPEWIKNYNGTSVNGFLGITLMPGNLIAAVGYLYEKVVSNGVTINAGVGVDPFFTVVDTAGDLLTLHRIHGDGYYDQGNAIVSDNVGNLYIGGMVADTIPDITIPAYHTLGGNSDFFVLKYGVDCSCTSMPMASFTSTGTQTINAAYTGTLAGLDSVVWNFGDGSPTVTGTTASHTYVLKGSYHVCAIVYASCGSDIYCNDVVVSTSCRAQMCMIDYNFHDDRTVNADMTTIQFIVPDILIDNTPNSYYGQLNGGLGCIPDKYTPQGIQVYSQLTSGYEGTKYGTSEDNLASNLSRIDAIAATDHATGIFLSEVTPNPLTASQTYLSAIYNECQAKGLKLILDAGSSSFAPWLMTHCDYLMSDNNYNGTRTPTIAEAPYLPRLLVIATGQTGAASAATNTLTARANGFGYAYACDVFTALPTWLSAYDGLINQKPPTPVITWAGGILSSNAPYGNQWYSTTTGLISGETNATYTPTSGGSYYDIVTLYGCSSDQSNVVTDGIGNIEGKPIAVFPNPAGEELHITGITENTTCRLINVTGSVILDEVLTPGANTLSMKNCVPGIYILELTALSGERTIFQVIKE